MIWVQSGRAYIVRNSPFGVMEGTVLHFFDGLNEVATGKVLEIQDNVLLAARVTSGSLGKIKRLDRVRIFADPFGPSRMPVLRLGYPSTARIQPFFACRELVPTSTEGYNVDSLSARLVRFVRKPVWSPLTPEPDTILVRLFDDAPDEEIALERGELDAAVFWPGEASSHIREVMQWVGEPTSWRRRGFVSAIRRDGSFKGPGEGDLMKLYSLNQDLFRNDLAGPSDVEIVPMTSGFFKVDSLCPGHREIEAHLNRGTKPTAWTDFIDVTYQDVPVDVLGRQGGVFAISCPILSKPDVRRYLLAIDVRALVNLFDCVTASRHP